MDGPAKWAGALAGEENSPAAGDDAAALVRDDDGSKGRAEAVSGNLEPVAGGSLSTSSVASPMRPAGMVPEASAFFVGSN